MTAFTLTDIHREVRELADQKTAEFLQGFFRTGRGQYGEGDQFLGIRVPQLRHLTGRCRFLPLEQIVELLHSPWHEERLLAILLLVKQYRRGSEGERQAIYQAYLSHTHYINNWDLVDASAEHILGAHLDPGHVTILEQMARSESVWERRMAIMATFHWIKQGVFHPTMRLATVLLADSHDLIHKAVGWMLREVGKRDLGREEEFLREHYRVMPRTMLRYAIERFPEPRRQQYLRGEA